MAESEGRCVFFVGNVHFKLPYATYPESTIRVFSDKICVVANGEVKLRIPLMRMRSIEIHQPIFGANYITGEYSEQDNSVTAFTMTFNKGGATDFARTFFSLTEGQLVSSAAVPPEPTQQSEEKKTK